MATKYDRLLAVYLCHRYFVLKDIFNTTMLLYIFETRYRREAYCPGRGMLNTHKHTWHTQTQTQTHTYTYTHTHTHIHTHQFLVRTAYFVPGFRSPTCNKTSTTQCEVKCPTIRVGKKKLHEPSYELRQYTENVCSRIVTNP